MLRLFTGIVNNRNIKKVQPYVGCTFYFLKLVEPTYCKSGELANFVFQYSKKKEKYLQFKNLIRFHLLTSFTTHYSTVRLHNNDKFVKRFASALNALQPIIRIYL